MAYFETRIYTDVEKYLKQLGATQENLSDLTEPLRTIATSWEESVKARFFAGGPGWAALAPSTIKRWGSHTMLINPKSPGDLFGSIRPFVNPKSAGVFATQAHAPLHDTYGRKAGSGTAYRTKRGRMAARRLSRGERTHGYEDSTSPRVAWGAMPARPFMFTDEPMTIFARDTLAAWIVKDLGD